MKKTLTVLTLILVISSIACQVQAGSTMWEIQGGKNRAYLLGSIHIMPENAYPLDTKIEEAFNESDVLVVELDATAVDQAQVQAFIGKHGIYTGGNSLKKALPEELFATIVEKSSELGLSEAQVNMFKPWLVSLNLTMGALQKIDIKSELGVDMHFLNKAKEREMKILELETVTSQLEALSSLSESVQEDYLEYAISEYDSAGENFTEMLQAWQNGDTGKLYELSKGEMLKLAEEMPGIEDYYRRLFTQRDREIAKKIKGFLEDEQDQTFFIIIGAFHMVGDDGLIRVLEEMGYQTEQY